MGKSALTSGPTWSILQLGPIEGEKKSHRPKMQRKLDCAWRFFWAFPNPQCLPPFLCHPSLRAGQKWHLKQSLLPKCILLLASVMLRTWFIFRIHGPFWGGSGASVGAMSAMSVTKSPGLCAALLKPKPTWLLGDQVPWASQKGRWFVV